jgi:hypothetical protein
MNSVTALMTSHNTEGFPGLHSDSFHDNAQPHYLMEGESKPGVRALPGQATPLTMNSGTTLKALPSERTPPALSARPWDVAAKVRASVGPTINTVATLMPPHRTDGTTQH